VGVPAAVTGVGLGVETGDGPAQAVNRTRGSSLNKKRVSFMG
jgi:hypothetical protein